MEVKSAGEHHRSSQIGLKRHLLTGGASMLASRLVMAVCGLSVYLFLTKALGPADYGLYGLAVSICYWFSILVEAVAGAGTLQLVAGNRDGDLFAVAILRLATSLGLILAFATAVSAPWLESVLHMPGLVMPLRIMAIDIPLTAMASVHAQTLMARGRFRDVAFLLSSYWFCRLALSMSLVSFGESALWATVALPVSTSMYLTFLSRVTKLSLLSQESVSLAVLMANNRKRTVGSFLYSLLSHADLLAVQWWGVSARDTGLYAAAKNLSNLLVSLLGSGQTVVLQAMSKAHGQSETDLRNRLGTEFLFACIHLGGLILSMSILCLDGLGVVLGSEYEDAGPFALVFLMGVGIWQIGSSGSAILNARGDRGALLPQLAVATPLAILCYRWLPGWLPGLSHSMVIAGVGFAVILFLACSLIWKMVFIAQTPFPWMSLWRTLAATAMALSAGLFVQREWLHADSLVILVFQGILVTLVYLTILWILGEKPTRFGRSGNG